MRVIMHVDMDAFYASCEAQRRPELAGKPIVIGADPKGGEGRGVVTTASYPARKFGVRSGMPISRAWKLCPQCVFLPNDFDLYARKSGEVMEILSGEADVVEQAGLDEAFLDVTQKTKSDFSKAEAIAKRVKQRIARETGLSASVGIGPNKLVAKIASDFQKPDGLTVVAPGSVRKFLDPLPVGRLWGVGKKTAERLAAMRIKTVKELAAADPASLREAFGKAASLWLFRAARGEDESPVASEWVEKSIGREVTFDEDTGDEAQLREAFDQLSTEARAQLAASGFLFKNVTIKVRFEGFETHTRSRTLKHYTDDLHAIKDTAWEMFKPFLGRRRIRLVGVRLSSLFTGRGQKKLA